MLRQNLGRTTLALLALAVVATAALHGDAAGDKKRTETKVSIKADKPGDDGKQTITVILDVNAGWYAYANPVGNEDLESTATVIKVSAKDKGTAVKVAYPTGKVKKDNLVGNYNVYEGKTEIPVMVQRAKGDTGPLEVSVRYMTCSPKGVCLPFETVKFTVP